MVEVPVSVGELCDRLAILDIKARRIAHPARREAAVGLARALDERWARAGLPARAEVPEWARLLEVNERLWGVEDELRRHEARADFGPAFVDLARSVYRLNDERAALKARIDARWGGGTEPKWFTDAAVEVTSDRTSRG